LSGRNSTYRLVQISGTGSHRRRQTREWLEKRERDLGFVDDAPSVALDKDQHD